MTLKEIQARFRDIAQSLGSPQELPILRREDGCAYAEQSGDTYFLVVSERGEDCERRQAKYPNELLGWFVQQLTGEIASMWEFQHRIPAQDSRRLRFARHVDLLREIDESWANAQEEQYREVLTRYPFDDLADTRADYFVELQSQGLSDDEAWKRAVMKFPEPVGRSPSNQP